MVREFSDEEKPTARLRKSERSPEIDRQLAEIALQFQKMTGVTAETRTSENELVFGNSKFTVAVSGGTDHPAVQALMAEFQVPQSAKPSRDKDFRTV